MLLASEFVLSENTCWAKSWKHVCVLRFKQWTGMKMRQNINKVNGPWSEVRFFWQENRVEWWLDSTILRILNLQLLHNCARFSEIETFQIMLKKSWKQLKNTLIHDFDSDFYLLSFSFNNGTFNVRPVHSCFRFCMHFVYKTFEKFRKELLFFPNHTYFIMLINFKSMPANYIYNTDISF